MFKKYAAVAASASLVLGVAILGVATATGPDPAPRTQAELESCTTNSTGYCTVNHGLGVAPDAIVLTPRIPRGSAGYTLSTVANETTAATVTVRAMTTSSAPYAGKVITFWMAVYAPGTTTPPPTTTTPSASTTTTAPPVTTTTTTPPPPGGCALPAYPDASCTGVPPGTVLSPYTGPSNVTVANTVIDSAIISDCLMISAPGVVIKNSRINAPSCAPHVIFNNAASIYHGGYSGTGLTIQDSEVSCYQFTNGQPDLSKPTSSTAIGDDNITALRLDIHGCENGFDMDGWAEIRDSFIHNLFQSETAHTDGLQSADGSSLILVHNAFYGDTWNSAVFGPGGCVNAGFCAGTSAVNINNCDPARRSGCPTTVGASVRDNLFAGGAYTLYCPFLSSGMTITGNHFSYRFRDPTSTAVYSSSTPLVAPPWKPDAGPGVGAFGPSSDCEDEATVSGNVYHETGLPVPLS